MQPPLRGIRVLDLGQIYMGPYCGLVLSYLGADVIKIEKPGGENIRSRGDADETEGRNEQFLNATKRGMELNLKSDTGKEILEDLVRESDVLIENYTPETMKKLGVGYETLSEINPELIYAQGSGYGTSGPYTSYPAMDLTIQAMGGVMETTGFPDGPPTKAGIAVADFLGGIHLATGIVSALFQREHTGEGQFLEVGMLDCVYPTLASRMTAWASGDDVPPRTGNHHSGYANHPYSAYEVADGYVVMACVTEKQWQNLAKLLDEPAFLEEERFQTQTGRATHRAEIDTVIENHFDGLPKSDVIEVLRAENIPCAPVQTTEEIIEDPQLHHREMINWLPNKGSGTDEVPVPGMPIKFADGSSPTITQSPRLGEHTDELLTEIIGVQEDELNELYDEGVIGSRDR